MRHRAALIAALLALMATAGTGCRDTDALERIRGRGEITVITRNTAHCYYTYRDRPMGFEYDLAKAFSDHLGVELAVITPGWNDLFGALDRGEGDFVAASLTVLPWRAARVDFSDGYLDVQQQVIVHKHNRSLNRVEDLAGRKVHVRRNTSYETRLRELQVEGLKIDLRLYDDLPTEELIRMVAEGEIEVTVADSNIAHLNRRYYPDIRMAFPIEEEQSLAWAVPKGQRTLLHEINIFFEEMSHQGTFAKIHHKYYGNLEIFDYVDLKKYHRRIETRLPQYRAIIRKAASEHGFDWRLIAAMVYQESHFNPRARSYTGVRGMMQLTLETAREMGIADRLDPEQSIRGGVRYLRQLYDRFQQAQDPDRLLMALASYNVGHGHVMDARELARRQGFNPDSWTALRRVLPLLRYPKYYKQTRHGYCRGTEPVRYVDRIMTYYDILKREVIS